MNRQEALRILGLSSHATTQDVKVAYRELAQIMHPDRFAQNEKLARRTADQFKLVTQAKDYLLSQGDATTQADANPESNPNIRLQALRIRIEALRMQLDEEGDRRVRGLVFMGIGIAICALFRAHPVSIIGSLLIFHGGFEVFRSVSEAKAIKKHLSELRSERDKL